MQTRPIQARLTSLLFLSLCLVGMGSLTFFEIRLYYSELSNKKKICQLIALQEQRGLKDQILKVSKSFTDLSHLTPILAAAGRSGTYGKVRELLSQFQSRDGIHAVGLILKNGRILAGGGSWVVFRKLLGKLSSSQSGFYSPESKSFVFFRTLKLRGTFIGHLVALLKFEPIQKALKNYHKRLRSYGFETCSVFLKGDDLFTGENLSFGHFELIRNLSREVGFERLGGHYLSMLHLALPGGKKAFLGSLIPQYEILSEVYQTGFIALLATLLILSTLTILVSHRIKYQLNSAWQDSDALALKAKNILIFFEQSLTHHQELAALLGERLNAFEAPATLLDQVVSSSKSTFQKTTEVRRLVQGSGESSEGGVQEIETLIRHSKGLVILYNSMEEIIGKMKELSSKIDIVAINASIEAARAGEKGRDFAAVADEIARLAQNSLDQSERLECCVQDSIDALKSNSDSSKKAEIYLLQLRENMKFCSQDMSCVTEDSRQQSERVFNLKRELMSVEHDINRAQQMVENSAQKNQAVLKETEILISKVKQLSQNLGHQN
jgi:hypothetical protein